MSEHDSLLGPFCFARGLYKGRDGNFTHIAMNGYKDGGRIEVPSETLKDFYECMSKDLENKKQHCLSERITAADEEFRCFFDLDFIDDIPLPPVTAAVTAVAASASASASAPAPAPVRVNAGNDAIEEDNVIGNVIGSGTAPAANPSPPLLLSAPSSPVSSSSSLSSSSSAASPASLLSERPSSPSTPTSAPPSDATGPLSVDSSAAHRAAVEKAMEPYSEAKVKEIVRVVVKEMRRYYPADFDKNTLTTIVTRAPVMMCKDNRVKHAFHLHQPWHIVNIERMLQFRVGVIEALRRRFGDRKADGVGNPWTDVVDGNIYGVRMGLRMVYNYKWGKCPHCNGKAVLPNGNNCAPCQGKKKPRNIKRIYKPWLALTYSGKTCRKLVHEKKILEDNAKSYYYALVYCSFRRSSAANEPLPANFAPYEGAPRVLVSDARKKGCPSGRLPTSASTAIDPRGEVAHAAIEVVRNIIPQYRNLAVEKFLKAEKASKCYLTVRGDGQHYCQNIQRDHNSRFVYFVFSPNGVTQRCFCRCEEVKEGAQRLCKNFESRVIPIPAQLRRFLFTSSNNVSKLDFRYNVEDADDGDDDYDPDAVEKYKRKLADLRAMRDAYHDDDDDLHSGGGQGSRQGSRGDVNGEHIPRSPRSPDIVGADGCGFGLDGEPPKKKKRWNDDDDDDSDAELNSVDEDYLKTVEDCNVSLFANMQKFVGNNSNIHAAVAIHHGAPQGSDGKKKK